MTVFKVHINDAVHAVCGIDNPGALSAVVTLVKRDQNSEEIVLELGAIEPPRLAQRKHASGDRVLLESMTKS